MVSVVPTVGLAWAGPGDWLKAETWVTLDGRGTVAKSKDLLAKSPNNKKTAAAVEGSWIDLGNKLTSFGK